RRDVGQPPADLHDRDPRRAAAEVTLPAGAAPSPGAAPRPDPRLRKASPMTRPLLPGLGLLLLLATAPARADDKPPADKGPPADPLVPVGAVLGVLQGGPTTDGLLTVRVTLRSVEPN